MTKALMVFIDYSWIGALLWALLGLASGALSFLGFFFLGLAGIALHRALYWSSWLLLLVFPIFLFMTLRLAVAWQKLRSERRG